MPHALQKYVVKVRTVLAVVAGSGEAVQTAGISQSAVGIAEFASLGTYLGLTCVGLWRRLLVSAPSRLADELMGVAPEFEPQQILTVELTLWRTLLYP